VSTAIRKVRPCATDQLAIDTLSPTYQAGRHPEKTR
jgi:hypothetical protein